MESRSFLRMWAAGSVVSAVLQAVFPERTARAASWRESRGWQREIALWNIATVGLLLRAENADESTRLLLVRSLLLLNSALGVNHLVAAIRSPRYPLHWLGASMNGAAIAVGIRTIGD
jgi:hypothetical protein